MLIRVTKMSKRDYRRPLERGQKHMPLLLNKEIMISRFKKVHADRYDYSLVEYKGSDVNVDIICKVHGVFSQRADGHAKGKNCPKCAKRYKPSNEEYIEKCIAKFGDRFDYSKTKYINTRTKVTVICTKHGEFETMPFAYLNSINGCVKCSGVSKLSLDEFIANAKNIHGEKYQYNKIKHLKNVRSKVIVTCTKHGDFLKIADQLLRGGGCPKCGNETMQAKTSMGLGEFVRLACEMHNSKYDYSLVNYINGYTKVKIICPTHGVFEQRPHGHLQTRGCEKCGDESKFNFRRQAYIDHCNKVSRGLANLYVIKCFGSKESFYKVGVTLHSVERRFKNVMPYNYEEVISIKDRAGFIWDLESQLHRLLKRYTYRPQVSFGGETECFSKMPKSVLKKIDEFRNSKQHQLIA